MKAKFIIYKLIPVIVIIMMMIINIFPEQAYARSLLPFSEKDIHNMDARFSTVYPKSFWQSTEGKVTVYAGSAILAAAVTYFTAGIGTAAATGSIAAHVGGTISALKGLSGIAALNAGLALLGGGTSASGNLSVLGGITLLNVVGDFSLAVALDKIKARIPDNSTHIFLDEIKIRMFYDRVSAIVKEDLKDLKKALEGGEKDLDKAEFFLNRIERKLTDEVKNTATARTAYNYLLLSVIQYNNGDFVSAKSSLKDAKLYIDPKKSSLADYIEALIELAEGHEENSINLLVKTTRQEPEVIAPYVILAQIYYDNEQYDDAFNTLKLGLAEANKKDCTLNWMAGNCLYSIEKYEEAIKYYKTALANMKINEMEAMYKLSIAKCYKKLGDEKKGTYWLDSAVGEVRKNEIMVNELKSEYAKN